MTYEVRVSYAAETDLKEAVRYILFSLSNPTAATALINEFHDVTNSLTTMPMRHPVAYDTVLSDWGIRCIRCRNYYLFYQVDDETRTVNIIRFLHYRQNWRSLLSNK